MKLEFTKKEITRVEVSEELLIRQGDIRIEFAAVDQKQCDALTSWFWSKEPAEIKLTVLPTSLDCQGSQAVMCGIVAG